MKLTPAICSRLVKDDVLLYQNEVEYGIQYNKYISERCIRLSMNMNIKLSDIWFYY